jgi:hypothetical protein
MTKKINTKTVENGMYKNLTAIIRKFRLTICCLPNVDNDPIFLDFNQSFKFTNLECSNAQMLVLMHYRKKTRLYGLQELHGLQNSVNHACNMEFPDKIRYFERE